MRRTAALLAGLALSACATTATAPQAPVSSATDAPPMAGPAAVPPGYQYLFGSGEGSALALTVWHALIAYARETVAHRPRDSVVLAPGSALVHASFVPCGDKPFAAVFDVDETMIWNLGFEARAATGEPYDHKRWGRWEKSGGNAVVAVPGAIHAVGDLRKMGVTVIFNTNRSAANAAETAAAITAAGLGEAVHGRTLFLQGDDDQGGRKDGRRQMIAQRYCVIAMGGDQLGDFSDLFNAGLPVAQRRQIAQHSSAAGLWGKGWFVLPNPVYGTALRGGMDDVFPTDKRWQDPAPETK